jgi:two-component system, response regulator / RNA-binding antiterminator
LNVLLAVAEGERARLLEQRLREIGDTVIVHVADAGSLADAVRSTAPDAIIVDVVRPGRDALDDLRRVNSDNPLPVVMFVDRDDRGFMEAAIAAGVTSYNIVDTEFPNLKPIVMAAVAIFRKHQQVSADLHEARTSLMQREAVDKAKALLMRRRKIDEPRAYRWLRRKAMNENKRIADIAAELLAAEAPEGHPK